MREEIKKLLKSSFEDKELFLNKYFDNCKCIAISDEYEIYELERWTPIPFNLVGVLFYNNKTSFINIFAVNSQYRGKKYGYCLLKYLTEDYIQQGREIFLHVRVNNENAIRLYSSFGFSIIETVKDYYNYTNSIEDGYLMSFNRSL